MRTSLLTLLTGLAACDPAALRQEPAASAPSELAEHRRDGGGDRKSLAACLHSCDAGEPAPTDRATCRRNCETTFEVTPTAVVDDGFAQATRCLQSCAGDGSTGASACRESCRAAAGAPTGRALARLEQCVDECGADATLSDDNRATCRLTCAQEARRIAGGEG